MFQFAYAKYMQILISIPKLLTLIPYFYLPTEKVFLNFSLHYQTKYY